MISRNFLLLIASLLFTWAAGRLPAQTVVQVSTGGQPIVYELTFTPSSDSINYRPYQNGYYVVPVEGGPGTLIVTKSVGTTNSFFVFTDFGELFVARSGSSRKAVLTCTAASNVSTTALFAIGDASQTLEVKALDVVGSANYAPQLSGYAVSADAQYDQLFLGTAGTDRGVAGTSALSLTYDEADSDNASVNNLSVANEVLAIQNRLVSQGFVNATQAAPASTSASTTGNSGGTVPPITPVTPTPPALGPGDLVVYRLEFSTTGESINYTPFTGGYYVVSAANDTAGGGGALILEAKINGTKVYKQYLNFGALFVAQSGGNNKGVMFAMDASSLSSTTFFAKGDAQKSYKENTPSFSGNVLFADKLKGYAFSADSQSDLAFDGTGSDIGVAGVSNLTANYMEDTSKKANRLYRSVATEVAVLEKELKAQGFVGLATTFDP